MCYVSCLSGLGVICLVCLGCLSFLPTSYIASVLCTCISMRGSQYTVLHHNNKTPSVRCQILQLRLVSMRRATDIYVQRVHPHTPGIDLLTSGYNDPPVPG